MTAFNESLAITPCNIHLFIKGEYIKRNFEQESQDVEWLKENWDFPLRELNIISSHYGKVQFLSDIIISKHKELLGHAHESSYSKDFFEECMYIATHYPDWLEKMYNISCEYGIAASELMIPYDIEKILELEPKKMESSLYTPFFINDGTRDGFVSLIEYPTDKTRFFLELKICESFDFDKVLNNISNHIVMYKNKHDFTLTEKEKQVLSKVTEFEDDKDTYGNSCLSRLFGLLQWDLRIQGYTLEDIRNIFNKLSFSDCGGRVGCVTKKTKLKKEEGYLEVKKMPCDNKCKCKNTLYSQLYTTEDSIIKRELSAVVQRKGAYSHKGKELKIERDVSFLEEGFELARE